MLHCQSHENGDLKQGTDHTVDNLILTWPVVTLLELSFPTKVLVPGHAALKQSRAICALLRYPQLGRLGWLGPTQPGSNEHGGGGSQQSGRQHNTDFWKAENRNISPAVVGEPPRSLRGSTSDGFPPLPSSASNPWSTRRGHSRGRQPERRGDRELQHCQTANVHPQSVMQHSVSSLF